MDGIFGGQAELRIVSSQSCVGNKGKMVLRRNHQTETLRFIVSLWLKHCEFTQISWTKNSKHLLSLGSLVECFKVGIWPLPSGFVSSVLDLDIP